MPHVPLQYDDLSQLRWDCLTVTSHTSIVQVSLILHAARQLVAMQLHKYHLLSSSIPGSYGEGTSARWERVLGAPVALMEQLQALVLPENTHNTATSGLLKPA